MTRPDHRGRIVQPGSCDGVGDGSAAASAGSPAMMSCAVDCRAVEPHIRYYPVILDAIPGRARRALDVDCGEGTLARCLRAIVSEVTGIDADPGKHRPRARATMVTSTSTTCSVTSSPAPSSPARSTSSYRWPRCTI